MGSIDDGEVLIAPHGGLDDETRAAVIRMQIGHTCGVAYDDLRCYYCARSFDGSTLAAMLADGPVALAGSAGALPVACKACYTRKHTNI